MKFVKYKAESFGQTLQDFPNLSFKVIGVIDKMNLISPRLRALMTEDRVSLSRGLLNYLCLQTLNL